MRKSLALVIGNDTYNDKGYKLDNAVNDAKDVAKKLETLGYTVILATDVSEKQFSDLIDTFGKDLINHDVGLFYFSGHGLQIDDHNYMTAIDTSFYDESNAKYTSVQLDHIIDKMNRAKVDVKILVLDACRNNPFRPTRGGLLGLAQVFAPKGTIIAFSTSPGQTASDGRKGDRNSTYTGALLTHIDYPYIQIEEVFKRVRTTVYNISQGKQISWEHTSLIGDYFFNFGQGIHSPQLPYKPSIIKDGEWKSTGSPFDTIIEGMRSSNWPQQSRALSKLPVLPKGSLDENSCFLLGRNILQMAHGNEFAAVEIMRTLGTWLLRYNTEDKNHVLNGMLYEVYFDSNGKFRTPGFKSAFINEIYALQDDVRYKSSFVFIKEQLMGISQRLVYIPSDPPVPMAMEIILEKNLQTGPVEGDSDWDYVFSDGYGSTHKLKSIKHGVTELLSNEASASYRNNMSFEELRSAISYAVGAPTQLLVLTTNVAETKDIIISVPQPFSRVLGNFEIDEQN